jgi:hypothetical protein
MPTPLQNVINPIVASHPFFVTLLGSSVTQKAKRELATKLLLYEVRGRPVNTATSDLTRFSDEWTLYQARPQLAAVVARLQANLSRYTSPPWNPGEGVLKRSEEFPGAYWGYRFFSAIQLPFGRDLLRAFYKLSSPVTLAPAKVTRYSALRKKPNNGHANLDRALMLMAENPFDIPGNLPEAALVVAPTF